MDTTFDIRTPASPTDRLDDGYDHLLILIKKSFEAAVANHEVLFTTDCENLYEKFLEALPEDACQHYTCTTCRNFVNHYGGLVTIDANGDICPVMWQFGFASLPAAFFVPAVVRVSDAIRSSKITGVFVTSERRLGMPKTGVWTHMSVNTPKWMIYNGKIKTAGQHAAEKNEEFKMLMSAVNKYSIDTIETTINILRSETLSRSEKFIGIAEWFLTLKKELKTKNSRQYTNTVWKTAATAPEGFCHISSSMIGTLLDDIQDGFDFESVKQRFNEKMHPLKYQRPQVAPTAGNVKRAEELVAKLGLADALKRRFARLDEIPTIWTPQKQEKMFAPSSGVFAGLKTKEETTKKTVDYSTPAKNITWEKFNRTVLPTAKKIELYLSGRLESFTAIIGPEVWEANPIVLWDKEELRNPYSWYLYHNGSYPRDWNLSGGRYVDVTGITLQPNMWQEGYEHKGKGIIFILKDCKDVNRPTLCLFPEILRSELREVRSTIEAYSKENYISGSEEASACGIRLQDGHNWNCIVRVTTDTGVLKYKLDRWD